jgi:predicted transcriptional regulator
VSRDLADLTDLHLLILGALWAQGTATIAEIHAAIRHRTDAAPKTIATLLARLEQRGIVTHHITGREGVYRALVGRRAVIVARMGGMLGSLFAAEEGAVGAASVGAAAVGAEVRDGDAERLRALLRRAERAVDER